MPLGAYGGKAEIMDQVLPAGKVFQAGTLSGNPVAVAAGTTTLRLLKEESPYEAMEHLASKLATGLDAAASSAGIPHQLQQIGSMMTLFFNGSPVNNWEDADQSDRELYGRFFWGND